MVFFVFSLCSLLFSIPFCPPVCLSPSLVVSLPSVIRGSIKGSDFKMEHFFQRLCLGLKKKKKRRHFRIREEKYESGRICTEMRSGGSRWVDLHLIDPTNHLHLARICIALVCNHYVIIIIIKYISFLLIFYMLKLSRWSPFILSLKRHDQSLIIL